MSAKRRSKLKPAFKVWLELGGQAVLGDGKARMLEAIDKSGSLAAGAESLHMSYRGLWGRLREMETRLGDVLVVRRTGGCGGGGSQLTPQARKLLRKYRRFRDGIDELVNRRFKSIFGR